MGQIKASTVVKTSAKLASNITDETGTGALVLATNPALVTPALGTPQSGVLTNCTGTASGLTAGSVTNGVFTTGNQTIAGNKAFSGNFGCNGKAAKAPLTMIDDVEESDGPMGATVTANATAINEIIDILKEFGFMAES